ncbi:MAG: M13 family metallopeptidase [Acidobacteria bacterium]|nr:M13 family metallopeptidase [Acidobacteriota bacterium]
MSFNYRQQLAAAALLFAFGVSALAQSKAFDPSFIDQTVSACDNFYRYAVGGWLKNNPIPAAYSSWGVDQIVEKNNFDILKSVLETAAKNKKAAKNSDTQMIGDFYASCMDEAAIDKAGAKPLAAYFDRIKTVKDAESLRQTLAFFQREGFSPVFAFYADADQTNSAVNIANLRQGGLSLPNRDYYTKTDADSQTIRDKFVAHMTKMFTLAGDAPETAKQAAETVMKMEMRLALASKTPVELRDPVENYHKMSVTDADAATPNFKWESFGREVGVPVFTELNVAQPGFFGEFGKMTADVAPADWQTYLRWRVLTRTAARLAKPFADENFNFYSTTLRGTKEQQPRWRRCLYATDGSLGEALGQEYVKRAFTPEAKKKMTELVENLFAAYRERLEKLDWMGESTRKAALYKLSTFLRKIGYPDKLRGYAGLSIGRKSYFDNIAAATRFENVRDLQDIGKPVDKTRWGMTPPTINAYYNPSFNEIVFPAGILQPPYFNVAADDAVNYGDAGGIIGHEMTHGFDDEGSQYDAEGNLKMWWTPDDRARFEKKADCIVDQFDNYEVLPGLKMQGKLTLGENIADLGGLIIAYHAFEKSLEGKPRPPKIDGFTAEQRFFLSYAVGWMVNQRPESMRTQVLGDPHALPEWRVIGPLSNMPEFAAAFQCKTGDKMVRSKPCQVW